jgi:surface polysaccharide O-acyltransferase-like enzyme
LPLASLIAATCLLVTTVGTYWLSFSSVDKKLNQTLFEYMSPQIIAYSVILFLAAKLLVVKPRNRRLAGLIEAISAASFTIYLVHLIFLDSVGLHLRWMLDLHAHRSLLTVAYILAVSSVTFILSWAFYLLCRLFKVPTWIAPRT